MRIGLAALVLVSAALLGFLSYRSVAVPACDRQIVMRIDSAMVSHTPEGIQINAYGVAESAGWQGPVLILVGRADGTAHVDFVACRPAVSAQVLTPIQTQQILDLGPSTRRIVIRARTNSMTVDLTH